MFGSILGRGAYVVKTNTISKPGSYVMDGLDQVPLMHGDNGYSRIKHREYVRDMSTSVDFSNVTFDINPANPALFPWLAALAQNYEQYKVLGLVFEWISESSNALSSTNTALGSVMMATQYNALDTPFQNKQQVLNYQFATTCKPAKNMVHPLECDPGQTPNQPLYMFSQSQQGGDKRLNNMGVLNFCSVGAQAASVAGQLWISYDILLIKPRISSGLGLALNTAFYTYRGDAASAVWDTRPLGIEAEARFDSIGLEFDYFEDEEDEISCTIRFPVGCEGLYLVQNTYFGNGVAGGVQSIGLIDYVNCTNRGVLYNVTPTNPGGDVNAGLNATVNGARQWSADNVIFIGNPNARATITYRAASGFTFPPGDLNSVGNILVCQLNNNLQPSEPAAADPGHYKFVKGRKAVLEEKAEVPAKLIVVEEFTDDESEPETGGPVLVQKSEGVRKRRSTKTSTKG